MSQGFRERARKTVEFWETLSEDEKKDILGWCPISDELIRKAYPNRDIDEVIDRMNVAEFKALCRAVINIYRKRKRAKLLRQTGYDKKAEALEQEADKEEAELKEEEVIV